MSNIPKFVALFGCSAVGYLAGSRSVSLAAITPYAVSFLNYRGSFDNVSFLKDIADSLDEDLDDLNIKVDFSKLSFSYREETPGTDTDGTYNPPPSDLPGDDDQYDGTDELPDDVSEDDIVNDPDHVIDTVAEAKIKYLSEAGNPWTYASTGPIRLLLNVDHDAYSSVRTGSAQILVGNNWVAFSLAELTYLASKGVEFYMKATTTLPLTEANAVCLQNYGYTYQDLLLAISNGLVVGVSSTDNVILMPEYYDIVGFAAGNLPSTSQGYASTAGSSDFSLIVDNLDNFDTEREDIGGQYLYKRHYRYDLKVVNETFVDDIDGSSKEAVTLFDLFTELWKGRKLYLHPLLTWYNLSEKRESFTSMEKLVSDFRTKMEIFATSPSYRETCKTIKLEGSQFSTSILYREAIPDNGGGSNGDGTAPPKALD